MSIDIDLVGSSMAAKMLFMLVPLHGLLYDFREYKDFVLFEWTWKNCEYGQKEDYKISTKIEILLWAYI